MTGKYEIFAAELEGFRFRLLASNGDIVMTSGRYTTKPSALQGLERARKSALTSRVVDTTQED